MKKILLYIFPLLRITFYILLVGTFIIVPTSYFINKFNVCFYYNILHIICPTCGVSRAFSCFLHLDFRGAFMYNPVFTTSIFPICILLFIDDFITYLYRVITKKENKYSLLEYLFKGVLC